MRAGTSHRGALAAVGFGTTAAASYALQRLYAALTPLTASSVLMQEHIPFYWRVAAAAFQGGLVAALVFALLGEDAAERWLGRTHWLLLLLVPLALAMVAVP